MSEMKISNTLVNDTNTGEIAYARQLKDNAVNYAQYAKITAAIKERFHLDDKFQDKLNNFFLYHYDEFHRFLEDPGLDDSIIDSWKEIQDFLAGLPDDETMWLKNQLTRLDNRITAMDIPDGGAYDISADHVDGGGNYAKYSSLSEALNVITTDKKKPGMTVRFIQTSDNKYVQFRYMSSSIAVEDFTNVANWQGVDSTITSGSKDLITSGGVNNAILSIIQRLVPNYTQSLQWYYGGGIDTSNGNIITGGAFATWYYIKDYIPVKPNTVYGNVSIGAFYDKDRNFIVGFQHGSSTETSPANAAFIRFCNNNPSGHKFWEGTAPDFDNISALKSRINEISPEIILRQVPNYTQSLQWYYGGCINPVNGNIITGGDYATWYYCKDYIPVKPNTVYGKVSIGAFYDKDRNFISGFQHGSSTETSPAKACFIRFCAISPAKFKFWEGTEPDFDNIKGIQEILSHINTENLDFHVGATYDYTTFSSAVAAAKNVTTGVPTIHVHSGTYNLIAENQAAANAGQNLVMLDKSVNIIFDKDAKLTANFDSSYQYYRGCSPIFIMGNADVCIDGMNIECSNCLYCIHDESYGDYTYTHKFINCVMSMTQEHNDGTVQCIGGGLGRFCRIEIVGGSYNSTTPGWDLDDAKKVAVSYHNGVNNSDNQNVIYVKDVYLGGKCRFNFSHCGNTQLMTNVYVSNCSVGAATTIGRSGSYYVYDNIQLFEWNMVVRD